MPLSRRRGGEPSARRKWWCWKSLPPSIMASQRHSGTAVELVERIERHGRL